MGGRLYPLGAGFQRLGIGGHQLGVDDPRLGDGPQRLGVGVKEAASSVAEDVAQAAGLDETRPPVEEPFRIRLAHPLLTFGIDGAELLLKLARFSGTSPFRYPVCDMKPPR